MKQLKGVIDPVERLRADVLGPFVEVVGKADVAEPSGDDRQPRCDHPSARGVAASVFTTAQFLRPLSGQAYKPADVTFSPRAARPGEWRGWR